MSGQSRQIPGRNLNRALSAEFGRDVLNIDTLPMNDGQIVTIDFEAVHSTWRQGVWVGTNGGVFEFNSSESNQFTVWMDTVSDGRAEVLCKKSGGLLHVHNIWHRNDRHFPDSLMAKSGMLVDHLEHGSRRYHCNDTGDIDFETLVFRVRITG